MMIKLINNKQQRKLSHNKFYTLSLIKDMSTLCLHIKVSLITITLPNKAFSLFLFLFITSSNAFKQSKSEFLPYHCLWKKDYFCPRASATFYRCLTQHHIHLVFMKSKNWVELQVGEVKQRL